MLDLYVKIKEERNKKGWTQSELAKKMGYSDKSMIAKIEKGKVDLPHSKIVDFAKVFDVKPTYLMGWEEDNDRSTKAIRVPVLGRIAAGVPIEAVEDIVDWEELPVAMANTGEYFCLVIEGDSMTPDIHNHDVVVVRQQPIAENGEVVIAMVNSSDAVCKRLRRYEWGLQLTSDNPAYEPLTFTAEEVNTLPVRILGKVVELRRKY